jgi:aldehyde dehydrogenase (NAD+)
MTDNHLKFYIDGAWVNPRRPNPADVINPSAEDVVTRISLGSADDVDDAAAAARRAFESYSMTSREERLRLLRRIVEVFADRKEALARAITTEIGAPISLSRGPQTANAVQHFSEAIATLSNYEFERLSGSTIVRREPIGVCGLITPWNFPINQIAAKLAPALATGCTVVLKPSEVSPLSALVLAEVLHEAGLPKGVFNLVNGDGLTVGSAIAQHPDVDMVSFTGSTRAGILVAKSAADTVKRVTQELGGKSPYLVMRDADLRTAVTSAMSRCFANSGQVCQAPTRLLVHQSQYEAAVAIACEMVDNVKIGDPEDPATSMGPLVNKAQFDRVQYYIQKGIDEGARLVAGGLGRPSGLHRGYYVRPTVFSDVMPAMTIAREEIFGPVMSIIEYQSDDEAISIANDTPFGLAAYVHARNADDAKIVASKIRAGRVYLNDAPADRSAPFGGYKQSGNGREQGVFGFEEYLEVKAILGVFAA